ncbi:Mitochondrial zinc maintenance protein 1, mitochondrial [Wickerhamiella sorbophila]|uniref:Mitochondrial zinc maintenance protein 1, mitochondrial n=1 Tax=Wickerhamiella sorbophila TaxID=45607 RepID=A0A2T0FI19_9ASCO|nr:Mitochondrial zinc maintenance protein 1, mitochondrial [Wickerhamiella sorbophila]PRT54616.1 Mitochondrial zinc maintenance protein 1, mitochondrial [Wickerhamiella sorbophila]
MSKSIQAYRGLIRAANLAFRNDAVALKAACDRIKSEYKVPSENEADLKRRIQLAKDVAHILRSNVVQGVKASEEDEKYKLNIHNETELGDNDDRFQKTPLSQGGSGGCCGGSGKQ